MKESHIRIALIGAGSRGRHIYGSYLRAVEHATVVAVAEKDELRRTLFAEEHSIPSEYCFTDYNELFSKGKIADAVIICTQDADHYIPASIALRMEYHILLEKPVSNNIKECLMLEQLSREYPHSIFLVSHVLRYTPFFSKIKEIIESGVIGIVHAVNHNENIGYHHFAHSFVRGNWRNTKENSPLILAKSCHDMDILVWLLDASCTSLNAYGTLSHFTPSNAPSGAGSRCTDCAVESQCPYSALKIYREPFSEWPTNTITSVPTQEGVQHALEHGPYGRCVYQCDNDVVDHMSMTMEFEHDITAVFNLSAFTNETCRTIKIMGSMGEIRGHMEADNIEVYVFGNTSGNIFRGSSDATTTYHPMKDFSKKNDISVGGHEGGDEGIIKDFLTLLQNNNTGKAKSSISRSIESHVIAFAAEQSRLAHTSIAMDDFVAQAHKHATS